MTPRQYVIAGQIALAVYAFLLIGGGVLGYVKAQSKPSLIAGGLSGIFALLCLALTTVGGLGFWPAALLAVIMVTVFGARLAKTRKLMPSGVLLVLSLGLLVLMIRVIGQME